MLVYDREVYTSEGLESGRKRWVYDGQLPLPDLSAVKHYRREYSIPLSEFKGKKQECIVIEENGVRYRYILSTAVDETEARVKEGYTYFIAGYYIWGAWEEKEVLNSVYCESPDEVQVGEMVRILDYAHWNNNEEFYRTAVCIKMVDPEFLKKTRYYPTSKAWKSKYQDVGLTRWDSKGNKYQEKRKPVNKSTQKKGLLSRLLSMMFK